MEDVKGGLDWKGVAYIGRIKCENFKFTNGENNYFYYILK